MKRLFRKVDDKSSAYDSGHPGAVRRCGSFIYEEFLATGGTDVKVYTVGPRWVLGGRLCCVVFPRNCVRAGCLWLPSVLFRVGLKCVLSVHGVVGGGVIAMFAVVWVRCKLCAAVCSSSWSDRTTPHATPHPSLSSYVSHGRQVRAR